MKGTWVTILAALSLSGISMSQGTTPQTSAPSSQPPATSQPANPRIAPGSVIPVRLTKSIDAKKSKAGDEIVAKVTQDLKTNNGVVLVPKDTKVVGRVTEAQPHSKEQKESEIGIAFDHAVLKNGSEMRMPLSVQAIIAPRNPATDNAGNGGGEGQPAMPSAPGGATPGATGGRTSGMGENSTPPPANAPTDNSTSTDAQSSATAGGPITGNTQGVVGFPDLKLATAAPDSAQGSVVSSEKNNVKLESGTFMLLRVNP